ncbi:MAG: hypothetical protein N3A38_06910 [Planctomycetota bacterium]|nr:hypothetical protein [Planctomycetota bacterium]
MSKKLNSNGYPWKAFPHSYAGPVYIGIALAVAAATHLPPIASGGEEGAGEREEKVIQIEGVKAALSGAEGRITEAGRISLDIVDKPLKQVLEYISQVSGINVMVLKPKDELLKISLKVEDVHWRAVVDLIARKYKLVVDDSRLRDKILVLDSPERVSMTFTNADVRDIISMISTQANANIVIGPEIQGTLTMHLEDVPWNDAIDIVVKTLDFVTVPEKHNTIRITSPDKLQTQLETRIFRLSYIQPEGARYVAQLTSEFVQKAGSKATEDAGQSLLDVLSKVKSANGTIAYEKRANALVVTDTAKKLDAMQIIIDKLDIAPKQIHIAMKLLELSDQDQEALGVKWANGIQIRGSFLSGFSTAFPFDISNGLANSIIGDITAVRIPVATRNPVTGILEDAGYGDITLARKVNAFNQAPTQTGLTLGSLGFGDTNFFFEMVRNRSNGRIIQAPQLITLDNEEATIQVGRLIRYAESFVANTEGGGNVSGFREAGGSPVKLGVQLLIIPHVTGPDNNILMTLIPKTETLDVSVGGGATGVPPGFLRYIGPDGINLDLPQTLQRIVVTKVLMRNGETVVIGGLREETEGYTNTRVPFLGDIPILGRLFRHKSRNIQTSNLLIFITPNIIDFEKREDLAKAIERVRNEYSAPFVPYGEEAEAAKAGGAPAAPAPPR